MAQVVQVDGSDAARGFDRFADPAEIARFAEAAGTFRADELGGRRLEAQDPQRIAPVVLSIREATDRLFRASAQEGGLDAARMSDFLKACADGLSGSAEKLGMEGRPFGDPAKPLAFEAALAVSALSLLGGSVISRLRICPNCGWLFADRSRNASRLWCDMAVCGNRRKAGRHYRRRKAAREAGHA